MMKPASFTSVAVGFGIVVTGYVLVVDGRAIGASIVPFITTSCSSSGPCIGGANSSSGAGVLASSANGRGLFAFTKHVSTTSTTGSYGVLGQDASASGSYDSGVYGLSVRGTGVSAMSTSGTGVSATSTNSIALNANSTNYLGVYATGPSYAVYGSSSTGYGVVGVTGGITGVYGSGASYGTYGTSGKYGVYGSSSGGTAVYASSTNGFALEAHTGGKVGAYVTNGNGNGADVTGTYVGVVARSNTFPLVLTNASGGNLFYVDGSGNVYYHGSLQSFVERAPGVRLYNPRSMTPAIEETGTAHLGFGRANVYFSANFARAIDARRGYQVFLTPDGDTRGLYVQGKYARGFIVHEVGGGRGSFDFDYRVYARGTEPEAAQAEPNARSIVSTPAEPPAFPVLHRSKP